jgi:hypothetical protein
VYTYVHPVGTTYSSQLFSQDQQGSGFVSFQVARRQEAIPKPLAAVRDETALYCCGARLTPTRDRSLRLLGIASNS